MMLTEGGESALKTNVNYLLEQFGISANSDSVIRNAFQKYMHPKEVLIEDGVREPGIASTTAQSIVQKASKRKVGKKLDKDGIGKLQRQSFACLFFEGMLLGPRALKRLEHLHA